MLQVPFFFISKTTLLQLNSKVSSDTYLLDVT